MKTDIEIARSIELVKIKQAARGPRYFSLPVMWMLCRRVQTAGSFLRLCQRKMRASYTDAVLRT